MAQIKSTWNWILLTSAGILLLVTLAGCFPAESSGTKTNNESTTTTAKPVRHPNYVRLINRKGNQNESVLVDNRNVKSGADLLANLPRDRNLTTDEIKSIIPYLEFTSTERTSLFGSSFGSSSSTSSDRPRPLSSLLNLLMGPLNALRNFGNRGRNSNSFTDTSASASGFKLNVANYASSNGGNKTIESRSSSTKSNSTSSSAPKSSSSTTSSTSGTGLFAGPGRVLAGMMKTVQSMTATFSDMIMSFLRLFNLNRFNLNSNRN